MAKSVRLQDAIDEYLAFRKADGIKRKTLLSDELFLRALVTEVGNVLVKSVNVSHIQRLYASKADVWSLSTRGICKTHLNSFFKYCRTRGWMDRDCDPVALFKRRKSPPRQLIRVPAARFPELLEAAPHPRDRMFTAVGLFLFTRPSETTALRLRDIELDAGYVNVYVTKSELRDQMPISAELDAELRRYLTWYATKHPGMDADWYLVPAKASGNFTRDVTGLFTSSPATDIAPLRPRNRLTQPERIIQAGLEKLGYATEREGGHTLRRSGARAYFDELSAKGYSRALKRVSAMLHHKNVAQTEEYLGLDVDIEERDQDLRGKPMFPSLTAPNVVKMHEAL